VIYDMTEEDIRPTNKMTHLMTYHFLDTDRLELIEELLNE